MLWMIHFLAVANLALALALPKALTPPVWNHGGLVARQSSPHGTPAASVVTHWSTAVIESTYTIPNSTTPVPTSTPVSTSNPAPTSTPVPTSTPAPTSTPVPSSTPVPTSNPVPTTTIASTALSSIAPPANPAVQYTTVTVTDPVYQTTTAIAGQAVETIYETVTTRVAAETYHVMVMYITSINTVVLPTTTRTMLGTGVSSVLTPAKRLARRSYDYDGTQTLHSFTTVPPITKPSSIVTSHTTINIVIASSIDTHITTTTNPPTTKHYSTTTKTAPPISTVYATVRPTIVQTVTQENSSTITSTLTVTVTETTGTTRVTSTSPIAVTLTDYAAVGIYSTRGSPVTSVVSTPVKRLRYS